MVRDVKNKLVKNITFLIVHLLLLYNDVRKDMSAIEIIWVILTKTKIFPSILYLAFSCLVFFFFLEDWSYLVAASSRILVRSLLIPEVHVIKMWIF